MKAHAVPIRLTAWWHPVLLGLGFYASATAAVLNSATADGIVYLWPANALLLVALLRSPLRHWPAFMLAVLVAEWVADTPTFSTPQALMFGLINAAEAAAAALFLNRLQPSGFAFDRLRNVALFGVGVLGAVCAFSGLAGGAIYRHVIGGTEPYWTYWQLWWLGDALGLLVLTPALLAWIDGGPVMPHRGVRRELAALMVLSIGVSLLVFSSGTASARASPAAPLLVFPLAIWAAARFGARSVALVSLLVVGVAIGYTARGLGPFADPQPTRAALQLQAFLASFTVCSLSIVAMLSELRRRNDALRLRERAIESLGEGVVIADTRLPDMPVIYVNPSFERLTGYASHEMVGRNCRVLQGTDREQDDLNALRQALQRGEPARVVVRNYRKNGQLFLNDLTLTPVRDEHGELCAYIGVQHDVTAMHEAESRLREAYAELTRSNQVLEQRVADRTFELESLNRQLDALAHTDSLTGIWNRRYFVSSAERAIAASRRNGRPLSLLMIDVDRFKAINDRHGHGGGDKALLTLTRAIQATLRPSDVLARFGGEEFVALLIDTEPPEAIGVAERWRLDVAQQRTLHEGELITFTVSIGVAQWQSHFDVDQLVRVADERLYAAKAAGRNRVCA